MDTPSLRLVVDFIHSGKILPRKTYFLTERLDIFETPVTLTPNRKFQKL